MRYFFEDYVLDTDRRELHRGDDAVSVAPQVFDLIKCLIHNRDRVVSKDDLITAVWGGRIVSDAALTTRLNVARIAIDDSGEEQRLIKTLPRKGFRFVGQVREGVPGSAEVLRAPVEPAMPNLTSSDKPSIAVLPFANLSSDPEQEYFADGVVEDITMALSRFHWFFVIARNSSFTYKGRIVDVKQVGRELGVRYVLEGSIRKSEHHIRIAGQLIDAETGVHLWADRFEGSLNDTFDLQDQVTTCVVGAIAPELQRAEIRRAGRKPPKSFSAYDHYLRGLASSDRWTEEGNHDALIHFGKAIELDPKLASAYGMAAWCYVLRKVNRWTIGPLQESAEATRLASKAVRLGKDDPTALCMGGYVLAIVAREFDDAAAFIDQALAVNPNYARAWMLSGWLRVWIGEPELALEHVGRAMRLSPLDPSPFGMQAAIAYSHFLMGRYDLASTWAEKAVRGNPNFLLAICNFVASTALAGRPEQTKKALALLCARYPDFRVSNLHDLMPFRDSKYRERFAEGLGKAGLPP